MADNHQCVAIYATRDHVADAVAKLQYEGFDMGRLSLVGRDLWPNPQEVGFRRTGNDLVYGGRLASWWERMWSILPGRGSYWFFGNGPLLIAGQIAHTFAGAQEGIGDLKDALVLTGIPDASAVIYARDLDDHRFLLIAQGNMETADHARQLLRETPATNHTIHHGAE